MQGHSPGDDPEGKLNQLSQRLQAALRTAFESAAAEPLPASLKTLLERLRAAEKKGPRRDPPED